MTVVSSKEFVSHQKRYFDLARNEKVVIKRGNNMFHLTHAPVGNLNGYDKVLEPDDDFRRAITGEELLGRIYSDIDRKSINP
jgi:hypothetical protein